ncbi:MAG: cellulose synthase subunit BcsC-related outer membrane protein, partial [Macromonas sp.]
GIGTTAFQSLAADAGNGATIREAFANFIDQRTAVLDITTDSSVKTGGDGTSTLKMQEVSAQLRVPGPYSGHWFLRAEPTSLRAGSLQISSTNQAWVNALAQGETVDDLRNRNLPIDYGNLYSLQTFGSLLLCGNDPSFLRQCPVKNPIQSEQSAQGTVLALGFQNDNLRADIGHTPTTFPVNYFTSGLTWKGDLGPLWYSTDVARRPLSSSVLTYAGTQDPHTGMVWGGVRSTGVTLGLGYDVGGPWGIWSNVGWQKLTGQHVEDNTRQSAMAGLYWRAMDAPTHRLQLGINSINFWYDKNLSEFTLGQGGYYSPQRYSSVSLPITWWQRGERWTLTTRAAVSYSNSLTKDAEYFPLNPDYQSQANNPIFSGGAGRGAGYSFLVSGEYQLQPRWVLGGRVELERSVNTNYQPNRATFYLRYHLEPSAKPLPWPPEALTPYSRF